MASNASIKKQLSHDGFCVLQSNIQRAHVYQLMAPMYQIVATLDAWNPC